MQEESNPIKDYLFGYVENSSTIPELIANKKFDIIINEIIDNCYDKIITLDTNDVAVGIFATGILHYLLTNALLNSQRKINHNGIELDIVIPDVKTLEKDPKKTLLIYIPLSSDEETIQEKIMQLEKIQSIKENIWIVLSKEITINKKSFILSKENDSFSKIIFEIAQFSNVHGTSKFKILRI